jgi:hypothetical protein
MAIKIVSLTTPDVQLKVFRNKPFNIALSSFLSVTSVEPDAKGGNDIGFSSNPNANEMVISNVSASNSTPYSARLAAKRFASVTGIRLPTGVSLQKGPSTITRSCNPSNLFTTVYPSNTRLAGTVATAGTYEFDLIADVVSIPAHDQLYTVKTNAGQPIIEIGTNTVLNIFLVSSDTIKITLIVENMPV